MVFFTVMLVPGFGGLGFRVKGFNFNDHNKDTILFSIDPYYGILS